MRHLCSAEGIPSVRQPDVGREGDDGAARPVKRAAPPPPPAPAPRLHTLGPATEGAEPQPTPSACLPPRSMQGPRHAPPALDRPGGSDAARSRGVQEKSRDRLVAIYDFDPSTIDWPFRRQRPLPLTVGQAAASSAKLLSFSSPSSPSSCPAPHPSPTILGAARFGLLGFLLRWSRSQRCGVSAAQSAAQSGRLSMFRRARSAQGGVGWASSRVARCRLPALFLVDMAASSARP